GRDTGARGLAEYPLMLRDEVWLSITVETGGAGVLCRADMERRLKRTLTQSDMLDRANVTHHPNKKPPAAPRGRPDRESRARG
ncbi:MAG: hypothetical protein ACLGP3_05640, partial [Acidobacteriota bacterium]